MQSRLYILVLFVLSLYGCALQEEHKDAYDIIGEWELSIAEYDESSICDLHLDFDSSILYIHTRLDTGFRYRYSLADGEILTNLDETFKFSFKDKNTLLVAGLPFCEGEKIFVRLSSAENNNVSIAADTVQAIDNLVLEELPKKRSEYERLDSLILKFKTDIAELKNNNNQTTYSPILKTSLDKTKKVKMGRYTLATRQNLHKGVLETRFDSLKQESLFLFFVSHNELDLFDQIKIGTSKRRLKEQYDTAMTNLGNGIQKIDYNDELYVFCLMDSLSKVFGLSICHKDYMEFYTESMLLDKLGRLGTHWAK